MATQIEAAKMATILGCPFCGKGPLHGLTKARSCQLHGERIQNYAVWCPDQHANVTLPSKQLAIAAWNTRAEPARDAGMAAEVEALRAALKEALATAVLSIAFLGRDAQTLRQEKTLNQLCDMWVKTDIDLRAALEARTDG